MCALSLQPLIRPIEPGDFDFILSSWLRSARDNHPRVPADRYFPAQQKLASGLSRCNPVLVACDALAPAFIMGWGCGRPINDSAGFRLHYLYVKTVYRRQGLGRSIVEALGYKPGMVLECTEMPRRFEKYAKDHNIYFDDSSLKIGGDEWDTLLKDLNL